MIRIIRFFFISVFFISLQYSFAAFVEKDKAIQVAVNFYISSQPGMNLTMKPAVISVYTDHNPSSGEIQFYAVNFSDTGFVIISAEDGISPVLGYSFSSLFTGNDIPVQLSGLLKNYRELILHVRADEKDLSAKKKNEWDELLTLTHTKQSRAIADPLLICKWDQGARYNGLCPEDPSGPAGHVYAGCVATAMSMVMYYFRYPSSGQGMRGYLSDYGYLEVDFSQSVYDYNEMPVSLTSSNYPVAKLMYDAGVAVDMMYSPNGSGAYMDDAAFAMHEYFKYSPNLSIVYRDSYSFQQWVALLKNQIDQGFPLIYAGYDNSGPGHAFVCDGYDSGNMFHFNWGWSGSYNGYYVMDYLTPGGYNFANWQLAVINCYPSDNDYPYNCQGNTVIRGLSGTFSDGSGKSSYSNNSNCSWLIQPETAINNIYLKFYQFDTEQGPDQICVYDGHDSNSPLIGCFSGNTLPPDITSSEGSLYITFQTNGNTTGKGFFAEYYASVSRFCDSFTILSDPSGTIEDGSGSYTYHSNTQCRWWIKPENAGSVVLNFEAFDLEPGKDFLILMDPSNYPSTEIIRFSGNQLPDTYLHWGSSLILRFVSNDFNQNSGWKVNYTSWPVSVDEISSENMSVYPNPFSEQLVISGIPGKSEITMFDVSGRKTDFILKTHTDDSCIIDGNNLSSGIYILQLISDQQQHYFKIIRE